MKHPLSDPTNVNRSALKSRELHCRARNLCKIISRFRKRDFYKHAFASFCFGLQSESCKEEVLIVDSKYVFVTLNHSNASNVFSRARFASVCNPNALQLIYF
ncbi:hypothetical protein P5V15_007926 [Pogonomyrmex californicus]